MDAISTLAQILFGLSSTINVLCYIFIVVCIIRHPGLQTITNYVLFSTGVSHIFFHVMCLVIVSYADKLCRVDNPKSLIKLSFCAVISVFGNTLLVAMETYVKVCHSFWYARVITEKKSFLLIAIPWIFCAVTGIVAAYFLNYDKTLTDCPIKYILTEKQNKRNIIILLNFMIAPSLLALMVLKIMVIRTARKHARIIAMHDGNNMPRQNPAAVAEERQKAKRFRKSTINLFIFVVTYISGWLPLLIGVNVIAFCDACPQDETQLIIYFSLVANLTSVSPLIYTLRQAEFARLIASYKQRLPESLCCRTVN